MRIETGTLAISSSILWVSRIDQDLNSVINKSIIPRTRDRWNTQLTLLCSSRLSCFTCASFSSTFNPENCQHAFCISCIREWRRGNDSSNDQGGGDSLAGKKTCPSCRTKSNLCIPSSLFHPPGPFKETIIENYKASCSSKPCHNYMRHKDRAIDAKCKDQYGADFERMTALQRSAIRAELSREVKGKCIFG